MNISVVMIVKNGAKTIRKALESIRDFDDVVVYDNGSTDDSIAIAKEFSNVNLILGEFTGFGPTKNKAATYAKHDWILIVDCDEVIDAELLAMLKTKALNEQTVYILKSTSYYGDTPIKHSGWSNQRTKRLYNRSVTSLDNKDVHEDIISEGLETELLKGNMQHYTYLTITDFIVKLDRYSTLFAEDNAGRKYSSPLKAILNGGYSFFRTYILKRGFLDGYAGLVIAFSHMATNFYKYIKLYERNLELKRRK